MQINLINTVISDPKKARAYIKQFCKDFGKEITYVDTPSRRIEFEVMTDEDAIFVANELQNMTSEAVKQRSNPCK